MRNDDDLVFELEFETGREAINNLQIDIALFDQNERWVLHCKSAFVRGPISVPATTPFVACYALRKPRLAPGHYRMTVYAVSGAQELCWVAHIDACRISAASPFLPGSVLDDVKGAIVPDFRVNVFEC